MGVSISRYSDITDNELIARFCSNETISPNDPFWNQMLSFNITPPCTVDEQLIFDSSTEALLQQFLVNNPQTGNLGSLIHVFMMRATELLASPSTDNAMLAWQTFSALFVIRSTVKYLVEMIPEYQLGQHLDVVVDRRRLMDDEFDQKNVTETPPPTPVSLEPEQSPLYTNAQAQCPVAQDAESPETPTQSPSNNVQRNNRDIPKNLSNESKLEMLCDALMGLLCDVPVTDNTYYLHVECMNTLLVLMSVYMFAGVHGSVRPIESSFVYRSIYGAGASQCGRVVRALLAAYTSPRPAPAHMFGCSNDHGSLVLHVASGIWNMLTFNTSSTKNQSIYTHPPVDKDELYERLNKEHPVANQSCLLLLALTNHCMNDGNFYRKALLSCEDSADTTSTQSKESNGLQMTPPRIDMAALHRAICATSAAEHTTLLLYLMLHSCPAYRKHVFHVASVDSLILPILQCLYNAPENSSHHIYMSLIVLLILTEDESFIKNIHSINIKNPTWYTERSLSEITLGSLCVLVIIRTVQYNIVRVRDKYLHTNCLAALANMSCEFRNLHPYVAQRLVSLYETLSKRRARLCSEIEGGEGGTATLDLISHTEDKDDIWEHVCVLDEVLRMLLEILNSCLTSQLPNNLNLVYALLHKKTIFTQEKNRRNLPILNNIEMVIGFFSSRLQRVQDGAGGGDLGVTEVLQCIKKGAEQWSSDRLKKFPDLKFRYVEEDKPEEFFTPYVWSLVSCKGCVHWASEGGLRARGELIC